MWYFHIYQNQSFSFLTNLALQQHQPDCSRQNNQGIFGAKPNLPEVKDELSRGDLNKNHCGFLSWNTINGVVESSGQNILERARRFFLIRQKPSEKLLVELLFSNSAKSLASENHHTRSTVLREEQHFLFKLLMVFVKFKVFVSTFPQPVLSAAQMMP